MPTALALALAASPEMPRPILAVFDLSATEVDLEPPTIDALTEYLSARLAASAFQCVPRAEIRRRLTAAQSESLRPCVDESCQIELGRELAATKALSTRISRVGNRCQLTAVVYDLRTATTETAATGEAECEPNAIRSALGPLADRLAGLPEPPPAAPAPPPLTQPEARPIATCAGDDGGPAFLGWCSSGTFVGVLHLGVLVYAGTAADVAGVGQVALVSRTGGSFYGGTQLGLANFVGRDFWGLVEAGGVNLVGGSFAGLAQAGVYNQVDGSITGLQVGGINRARRVNGVQIGLLNFAGQLNGVQLGLLNFADNGVLGVLPIFNLGF